MNNQINSVLNRLEKQSELEKSRKVDVPAEDRMLAITKDTGLFYNILLKSSKAKRILEIGLSTGYSTLWFAEAILENRGGIITIEQNPSKIQRAQRNFQDAGISKMITIKEGNALEILNQLEKDGEKFDFVFIDADKENCMNYFELVFPMVNPNGIIGTDNMLYPEKYQKSMKKYSDYIKTYSNAKTMTLEIGNGQELTVKNEN